MAVGDTVVTRTLLSATVVERRSLPSRGFQYKLHIVSDKGELSVWHKYKTFQNLATTLTIQLLHDGITEIPHGFDLPRDDTTVDLPLLNTFLLAAVETDLDWGIRIDASTVVYKPKRPSSSVSSSSFSFVDRKASMAHHDDTAQRVLLEARIIDARVVRVVHPETMKEYDVVQYCLALETRAHGPMRIWRRYSTFSSLAMSLQQQCPRMRHELDLPEADLRSSQLSASNIQSRIEVLNQFLLVACKTAVLEWGIRIDADTCVYKRKVVDEPRQGIVLYEEPAKACCVAETVSLISAKVAGFRVGARKDAAGHASVKYNLQMDCLSNLGGICTYSIWRRFSTFEELAKSVAGLAPHIPSLRASDDEHHDKALVQRRVDALNHLFDVLSACDELEWAIRVDADTTVYKHRVV